MFSLIVVILYFTANSYGYCINTQDYTLNDIDPNYGKTWIFYPDGDGHTQIMYLSKPPKSRSSNQNIQDKVKFELYTRKNKRSPKQINVRKKREAPDELELDSDFNPNLETKFIVHGWKSSGQSDTVQNIKNNYLDVVDCNVIAVDWEEIASSSYYFGPVVQTREVGKYIASMIDYLVEDRSANTSMMHLIGHSLGAHTVGYAGAYTKSGRISRITGLDPAKPGFEHTEPESRLDPTDAEFVDVIHTSAGTIGYYSPLGHVDFYPNGGEASQPGCKGNLEEIYHGCSHGRSHFLYAESILRPCSFDAIKCNSYFEYLYRRENCKGQSVFMGYSTVTSSKGVYYLNTSGKTPFGLGSSTC